jgi:hypothetical protein
MLDEIGQPAPTGIAAIRVRARPAVDKPGGDVIIPMAAVGGGHSGGRRDAGLG